MERREYVKNCGMTEAIAPPEALSGTASPRNLDRAATTAYISHK